MRSELVVDLFHHLGRLHHFEVGHAGRETEAQLEALALPMDVKRLLQWRWPVARVTVGPYTLSPAHDILKHDDLERLLAAHMVPVGDARNGDIVVIRFSETWEEIGLVSHDDLWEGESSPDEAYVVVCRSVDEFLYRASEDKYLPRDSFAADEWQQLRLETERGSTGPRNG